MVCNKMSMSNLYHTGVQVMMFRPQPSLVVRDVLDIAVHRDAALLDLLALCAHEVLDGTVLAVLRDFLQMSVRVLSTSPLHLHSP